MEIWKYRRSSEACPYDLEHIIRLHISLSMPDGPAEPFVDLAAFSILCSSILSKITGSTLGSLELLSLDNVSQVGGAFSGCFSSSPDIISGVMSCTPVLFDDTHLRAAPTLPCNISLTKTLSWCAGFRIPCIRRFWIALPSFIKSVIFPDLHFSSRFLRCATCSLFLLFLLGFWSSKGPIVMRACMATDCISVFLMKWLTMQAISSTNSFPIDPDGSRKRFGFQLIMVLYAVSSVSLI